MAYARGVRGASSLPGFTMRWCLTIANSSSQRSKRLSRQSAAFGSSWIGGGPSGVAGAPRCATSGVPPGAIGANLPARSSGPCQPSGACGFQPTGPWPWAGGSLAVFRNRMSPPAVGGRCILRRDPDTFCNQSWAACSSGEGAYPTDPRVQSELIGGAHKGWRPKAASCYTPFRYQDRRPVASFSSL
jgi:hypothetical protein